MLIASYFPVLVLAQTKPRNLVFGSDGGFGACSHGHVGATVVAAQFGRARASGRTRGPEPSRSVREIPAPRLRPSRAGSVAPTRAKQVSVLSASCRSCRTP